MNQRLLALATGAVIGQGVVTLYCIWKIVSMK